ncbi:efflux RND transporter periplasmic adaptor subunit [Polycladidibacter stylochi]|uniref:efflux RND transporter periplasmic adaptor subunit n=1 Tax=Polycladidibacter stylochi TaxID=1807766 RepID=UPI00083629AC|nr:efflux RND transporter periplasmic adaptor subunit [Pseudovibrio stylochi]
MKIRKRVRQALCLRNVKHTSQRIIAISALGLLFSTGAYAQPSPEGAPAPAVIVEKAKMQQVDASLVYAGRTESISNVALIARVGGFLGKFLFKEGQSVNEGQTLFEIERKPYVFAVDQAEANMEFAQAQVDLAKVDFDRKKQLVDKDTISVSELDTAKANLKQANASLEQRKAELELAKLNLSYTEIKAPVTGVISKANYQEGAYVTAASGTLATVTSLDPIRVAFPIPQATIMKSKMLHVDASQLSVKLRLTDGSFYNKEGTLDFLDAQANPGTDTVTARVVFPNPGNVLFDKQLVDIVISEKNQKPVLTVPQNALLLDQEGAYLLTVDKENKVQQKRIEIASQRDGLVIVKKGLTEGELVITSGIQKVRPGVTVKAQLAGQ